MLHGTVELATRLSWKGTLSGGRHLETRAKPSVVKAQKCGFMTPQLINVLLTGVRGVLGVHKIAESNEAIALQ